MILQTDGLEAFDQPFVITVTNTDKLRSRLLDQSFGSRMAQLPDQPRAHHISSLKNQVIAAESFAVERAEV
jgi:hypothetical protein